MLLLLLALAIKRYPDRRRLPLAILAGTLSTLGPVLLAIPGVVGSVPAEEPRTDTQLRAFAEGNSNPVVFNEPGFNEPGRSSTASRPLLREGTRIPLTYGRFVLTGRRWAFVSDAAADAALKARQVEDQRYGATVGSRAALPFEQQTDPFADDAERTSQDPAEGPSASVAFPARSPRPTADPTSPLDATGSPGPQPLRSPPATRERTAPPSQQSTGPLTPALPQILVLENQLLERIAVAVRNDAVANRWAVTGVVTEFFGENHLILHTAQRADGR